MLQSMQVMFLDRDGVINKKAPPHQYITEWDNFEFMPGIFDFLRELSRRNFLLVIVTNQQGVGKKIFSLIDLEDIHEKMQIRLMDEGVKIHAIYVCPHLEQEKCDCRKPRPGLLHMAEKALPYSVDKNNSYLIGDSETDVIAAHEYGVAAFYLSEIAPKISSPEFVVKNHHEVITHLDSINREF